MSFVSLFLLSLFSFPPLVSQFIPDSYKSNWDKIHVELGQNSRRTGTKFTSNWDKIHVKDMGQRLITCPICVMDEKNGREPLWRNDPGLTVNRPKTEVWPWLKGN